MKYDCLLIDDEEALSQATLEYFTMFDIKTAWVDSKQACLDFFATNETSLILLDINLGNDSGFELCKQLRKTTTVPILFISARTSDDDMLLALNIGGDDYIQKPYSLSVLLAKVKVVLKRFQNQQGIAQASIASNIEVDYNRQQVIKDGVQVAVTSMEYRLLVYLIENKGKVVTKEELFQNVWQESFTGDGTLNVHIRRLREKLEPDPNNPSFIHTVWGVGYRFEEVEQ